MTPEEITAMAKEAGFPFNKYGLLQGDDDGEIDADAAFASFAALVAEKAAAKEREACALVCDASVEEWLRLDGSHHELTEAQMLADEIRARASKEGA